MDARHDCIVVGAGPAGLSAALYMARYRRDVLVLHDGRARALRIPRTHNAPGFPDGISGVELVERMQRHAREYGARVQEAEVVHATHADGGFTLRTADGGVHRARTLILATGLFLNQIPLPSEVHEAAIRANVLRYCPVCDGFEHIGKRVAVVGCDEQGASEALFLRQYTDDITLLPRSFAELTAPQRDELAAAGIRVVDRAVAHYAPGEACFDIHLEGGGDPLRFDVVYPALGCRQRTELAVMLGVPVDEAGCADVRSPFRTQVPGLYCAGDIVDGLDQISVAMGHGAIAATHAHNFLREQDAHTLQSATDAA